VLMVEVSGSACDCPGSTRGEQECESTPDSREQMAASL
jgi:hypothetical protein